jgi:hypothetical protein
MNITKVELEDNTRIFILDKFFDSQLVRELNALFNTVTTAPENWPSPEIFKHYAGRQIYAGTSPILDKIRAAANSDPIRSQLSELLGHNIKLLSLDLWVDSPGYTIHPHVDPAFFAHAVQIYITDNTTAEYRIGMPFGTTVYHPDHRVLFQLPYRTNSGYFFENPQQTCHGLNGQVPEGMQRNSVYLRFVPA